MMRLAGILAAAIAVALSAGPAMAWDEPARGSQTRKDLMNAIRPLAEGFHGPPLLFVVDTLRVAGDVGYGVLLPMRPGGDPRRFEDAYIADNDVDMRTFSGTGINVVYARQGARWRVVDWSAVTNDVWWVEYCGTHRAVMPNICAYAD
ncbi:MAG: hypothetical protein AAF899_03865 [Pseudomonadota bacterium]